MQILTQGIDTSPSPPSLLQLCAQSVLQCLSPYGELPQQLIQTISRATVRLMDSDMLITQTMHHPEPAEQLNRPSVTLTQPTHELEHILDRIRQDGLALHYRSFMQNFAHLFSLFLTPEQYERARASIDGGSALRFLMSDAGGPTLNSWRTIAQPDGDGFKLHVDKVWGMYAHLDGMAIVAARTPGSFFPSAFLVWPDQYKTLKSSLCGTPFLGDVVQLANVKGTVQVSQEDRLKVGGPAVLNKYLTTVRPFLVRALMAHLDWLESQGRIEMTQEERASRDFIAATARAKTQSERYESEDVQRVLALKFASNELLLHLVSRSAVSSFLDQRDLLAFTKMEGSSYRCYHELRAAMRVPKPVSESL